LVPLESCLGVFFFKGALKRDPTLNIDDADLAVVRCEIGLSVCFVLPHFDAVDVGVVEYTLVHHHKLAVKAGIYFKVLGSLDADSREKLVVERIGHSFDVAFVRDIYIMIVKGHLLVVSDESTAVDPKQTGVDD